MELTPNTTLHGFDITRVEPLPEIDGDAVQGVHAASGARLLLLRNDDNNKSFAIGFRTPPKDDTGVFHILEHSVLCGSRRFPVKEPFVDLLKNSMQTFLNAMTFADKTLYPVASTNEQDLFNLMDVYLDAVFHPNIYEKRQIFEQEGWHYELHANEGWNVPPSAAGAGDCAPTGSPDQGAGDCRDVPPSAAGAGDCAPTGSPDQGAGDCGSAGSSGQETGDLAGVEIPVGAQSSAPWGERGAESGLGALPAEATELIYNGVVFNEMKGALSDATSVLYDEVQAALFPGTCYAFESGGTPAAIPTLTYEDYLDEHRRHYRTDNSYLILYGNVDVDRALAFLDERYLQPVAAEQAERDQQRARAGLEPLLPRAIEMPTPERASTFVKMPPLTDRCGGSHDEDAVVELPAGVEPPAGAQLVAPPVPYTRKTMDTAPENACAACGYVIGDPHDRIRAMAVEILLDALFGSNESPLKRALLDRGVAHDVHAFVSDALARPFALVQFSLPAEGIGESLAGIVSQVVREMLDAGLDKSLVEAALAHEEFQMREHDLGMADGVVYAMMSLSTWLYDDDAPIDYLRYESAFAQLREALDGSYFEQLCIDLFLENPQVVAVEVVPTPGESDDDAPERLAQMNRNLTPAERQRIVAEEALLRQLQEAPDAPEDVAKLPHLAIGDIGEAAEEPAYEPVPDAPLSCVRHRVPTHGIAYAYRYYDVRGLTFDDLPYLSILASVLGKLDTAHHTAAELDTLAQGKLGNLTFFTDVYAHRTDLDQFAPKFVVSASSLPANAEWLATLPREIMLETDFSDTGKILNVLQQRKIGMEHTFTNAGHSCATARLKSYYAPAGLVREQLGNVGFYRFLCDLLDHFDERREQLSVRLAEVAARVFCDDRCVVSVAGSDDELARFWEAGAALGRTSDGVERLVVPAPTVRNEAFVVPSDVCYAATGWDRRLLGAPHTGAWLVASRALSYDYLWNEVRVKGGAYGTGFSAMRSGTMRFYSYRDPHLDDTLARFAQTPEWLARFSPAAETLEGFVVATVAGLDAPIKPRELICRQMGDYFTRHTPAERAELRDQVIATTAADVQALAPTLQQVLDQQAVCAFGNRAILEGSTAGLEVIPLVG